jgi:Rv2525c-like, glycoside hydrolase-like domain
MRRAIAAAVTGGLMLGGAVAVPSFAMTSGTGKAPKAARPATNSLKTVVYEGYEFQVPASWPVYRLDEHPQTCVRYDVHAVYLGKPGPNMRCSAGLVGRTQTVSFIPGAEGVAGTGARRPGQPAEANGTEPQRLPAGKGAVTQNAVQHELSVALGAPALGATVLGTYGTDPAVIEQVLGTLHQAPANAVQTARTSSVPTRPGADDPGSSLLAEPSAEPAGAATQTGPAGKASTSWPGVPAHWPVQIVQAPPKSVHPKSVHPKPPTPPKPTPTTAPRKPTPAPQPTPPQPTPAPAPPKLQRPVDGFDTCTAPSLSTMHVWRSDYAAVGIYIGGLNAACAYGNLSAEWVRTVVSSGWGLLPIYVGPQAPCWGGTGVTINPGKAAAEGRAAAADAVSDARAFGIVAGSPIFYDLEGYSGPPNCTTAVLSFMGAWDRRVAAGRYVAGVYSSEDAGIDDMRVAAVTRSHVFAPPVAAWIALWDNKPSLQDSGMFWPASMRAKQYAGNVSATVGGITLNVDKDIVGGSANRWLTATGRVRVTRGPRE